jgi:hypothetical protein
MKSLRGIYYKYRPCAISRQLRGSMAGTLPLTVPTSKIATRNGMSTIAGAIFRESKNP